MEEMEGERKTFSGTFVRFGIKNGWNGPEETVLLTNIKDAEEHVITDHLWFNLTKGFKKLGLRKADVVSFNARVAQYEKGYKGYRDDVYSEVEIDYKLSYPSKVRKLTRQLREG